MHFQGNAAVTVSGSVDCSGYMTVGKLGTLKISGSVTLQRKADYNRFGTVETTVSGTFTDKRDGTNYRKYTVEWYMDRINAIRRIIPDCGISTDMFVGYHGETEEDHQQSLVLMRTVGYDSAFMFKYSERPGTYASKHLPDDVPEEEKIRRLNEMIHLQTELSAVSNKKDEGKVFDVLVEGFSKRSREQLCGRTEQNKMVVFDKVNHHIGETVRVRIVGSTSATLFGEAM